MRIYGEMVDMQSKSSKQLTFTDKERVFQGGNAFGLENTAKLIDELIDDGLVSASDDGSVWLTDWERYTYGF